MVDEHFERIKMCFFEDLDLIRIQNLRIIKLVGNKLIHLSKKYLKRCCC
jgi:hypothetical protein